MSKTLDQYLASIPEPFCRSCGARLFGRIEYYPHSDGWTVEGFNEKQWLYITCSNRYCKYQNALWKLGVTREANVSEKEREKENGGKS